MDSNQLAELAAEACDDKKAKDIQLIRIAEVSILSDWIIITEGLTDVNVRAIIQSVEDKLKVKANRVPIRREGINEGKWALLDYGDLIINVFQPHERQYYELESFWSNGEKHSYLTSEKT
ncbi:ribosome silencing factor [Prochlorococcus sp. MIT 1307]|uniref:ribosome silencing factor n=1 Tax=Prochlorococcus sp. MIT 1307 TaxID=3096219 RepID=UPI002A7588B8|nr:ribosome silencing factor [Prochlorococcus sp. MIT 1307]